MMMMRFQAAFVCGKASRGGGGFATHYLSMVRRCMSKLTPPTVDAPKHFQAAPAIQGSLKSYCL
ncbi:hypothetical protein [Kingella oralis]|uniref:hypothetical protein n=1 Tax=Kingella oralis TaxID=505 RepID=UPI0034E58DE9